LVLAYQENQVSRLHQAVPKLQAFLEVRACRANKEKFFRKNNYSKLLVQAILAFQTVLVHQADLSVPVLLN